MKNISNSQDRGTSDNFNQYTGEWRAVYTYNIEICISEKMLDQTLKKKSISRSLASEIYYSNDRNILFFSRITHKDVNN